ncbi:MAG: DnaB-like helicase C-terminal domain-containing protein [Bacteroidota bacterium]
MKEILINKINELLKQEDLTEKELCADLIKAVRNHEYKLYESVSAPSMSSIFSEAVERLKNGQQNHNHIQTNLKNIDNIIKGLSFGELILVGGRPGIGKSTLMIHMSLEISLQVPVLYVTFDTKANLLINRFASALTGVNHAKISFGELSAEEVAELDPIVDRMNQYPIYINDDCRNNISNLRALCIKQIKEHGVRCIFIDYIQILSAYRFNQNRDAELNYLIKEIKEIALEYNVCIIAGSQLSRAVETRGGVKRPMLSDLRESGALEQYADKIFFIYRHEYYDIYQDEEGNDTRGMMEVIVAKNNNGNLGTAKLIHNRYFSQLKDSDAEEGTYESKFNILKSRMDDFDSPPF